MNIQPQMHQMPIPRYYQREAVDALWHYFDTTSGHPLVAMPTGTGKSLVIGGYIYTSYRAYPGVRALMLTRSQELVKQNFKAINSIDPFAPVGIFSAGLKRKEAHFPITYGNVQSVVNVIEDFGHIDYVIIDEAHLVSPKANTQYQHIYKVLSKRNPFVKFIGFTATKYRMGQGMLTDGGLFTDVCYDLTDLDSFNRLVNEGYLCPLVSKPMHTTYDLSNVRALTDDYNMSQVDEAINTNAITYAACEETVYYGQDRNAWLVFAVSVAHAEAIAECLRGFGIVALALHHKSKDRDAILRDFANGNIQAVVNNNMLTTGFDDPRIDLISCKRPTLSTPLWVQMLGRGTRPHESKDNTLVLDFARNTETLGPINDPVLPEAPGKSKGGGGSPFRTCETCGFYNHTRARFCSNCGEEFPATITYERTASHAPVMITEKPSKIVTHEVNRVMYAKHAPLHKTTPTLRVSYTCGFHMFVEWIPLEHSPPARHKAVKWWNERSKEPPPDTIDAALSLCETLKKPDAIHVDMSNKRKPRIVGANITPVWQE